MADAPETFKEVYEKIASCSDLKEGLRTRLLSSMAELERCSARRLAHLAASAAQLRDTFDSMDAAALTIGPIYARRMERDCMTALRLSGHNVVSPGIRQPPLPVIWARAIAPLSKHQRGRVLPFARYCAAHSIAPQDANDSTALAFADHLKANSVRRCVDKDYRDMVLAWNAIPEAFDRPPTQPLTMPPSRKKRTLATDAELSATYTADVLSYSLYLTGKGRLNGVLRPRMISSHTLSGIQFHLRHAATTALKLGVEKDAINSIGALCQKDIFDELMAYRAAATGGNPSYTTHFMACTLIQAAKDWVGFEASHIVELRKIRDSYPRPTFRITEKNLSTLRRFDEERNVRLLLMCPDRILADVEHLPEASRNRRVATQVALAIRLLTRTALRIGSLVKLSFSRNFDESSPEVAVIKLFADQVKGGRPIEFELMPDQREELIAYRKYVQSFSPSYSDWFFGHSDGRQKARPTLADAIERYLRKYLGFHMHAHAFRHLMAKFILDDSPGAYEEIQRILGHANIENTADFYSDFERRRAGAHHMRFVEAALADVLRGG